MVMGNALWQFCYQQHWLTVEYQLLHWTSAQQYCEVAESPFGVHALRLVYDPHHLLSMQVTLYSLL